MLKIELDKCIQVWDQDIKENINLFQKILKYIKIIYIEFTKIRID